jgi:hypothetical protein
MVDCCGSNARISVMVVKLMFYVFTLITNKVNQQGMRVTESHVF